MIIIMILITLASDFWHVPQFYPKKWTFHHKAWSVTVLWEHSISSSHQATSIGITRASATVTWWLLVSCYIIILPIFYPRYIYIYYAFIYLFACTPWLATWRICFLLLLLWRFLKSWCYPQWSSSYYFGIFHEINHPAIGVSPWRDGNPWSPGGPGCCALIFFTLAVRSVRRAVPSQKAPVKNPQDDYDHYFYYTYTCIYIYHYTDHYRSLWERGIIPSSNHPRSGWLEDLRGTPKNHYAINHHANSQEIKAITPYKPFPIGGFVWGWPHPGTRWYQHIGP